jgi:hypothetical protein
MSPQVYRVHYYSVHYYCDLWSYWVVVIVKGFILCPCIRVLASTRHLRATRGQEAYFD